MRIQTAKNPPEPLRTTQTPNCDTRPLRAPEPQTMAKESSKKRKPKKKSSRETMPAEDDGGKHDTPCASSIRRAHDDDDSQREERRAKKARKQKAKMERLNSLPKVDADGIPFTKIQIRYRTNHLTSTCQA